ncbi:MAG: SET domain-containing protein-lysine N-methyltransferase, partial [Gammaproteobacteria bacterium]|nr:SET domain-containing protein-lysine N-methyltransferase [Gammaproteobacteria bacterium]
PATRDGMYVLWVFDEDDPRQPVGRSGRNLLRYINHESPGNAAFDGFDLYACCVIGCDQEITIDYASGP